MGLKASLSGLNSCFSFPSRYECRIVNGEGISIFIPGMWKCALLSHVKGRSPGDGDGHIKTHLGTVGDLILKPLCFQSSFRAVSEQFQSSFRAFTEKFQSSFRAVSEQF